MPNFLMLKKGGLSLSLGSFNFSQNFNVILKKVKSVIPPLFNGTGLLTSISDKTVLFVESLDDTSLDNSNISVPPSPSRTALKLYNFPVTPKMVKQVITDRDSSEASASDCIPVVVLKIFQAERSYILASLFNMCLKESCFPE